MSNSTLQQSEFTVKLEGSLHLHGHIRVKNEESARPVLIITHGFRGSKDTGFWPEVSTWFAEQGFYTVTFDFSRISAKADQLDEEVIAAASTISQELSDIGTIAAHVQQGQLPLSELADVQRISLLGHSRSGASIIIYASEHPEIKSIAVWNGGATPNRPAGKDQEITIIQAKILEDVIANERQFDVPKKFSLLSVPALIVQGDQDNESMLASNKLLQGQVPTQTFVSIKGANHTFNVTDPYSGATPYLKEAFVATSEFLLK